MRQLGRIFPLFLAASAPGWAQWLFVEHNAWQNIAPPPKKAVIADITATLTAPTPWGPFTETETGKYWRSRGGRVRQDNSYGLSTVIDLGSSPRSLAYIDHALQRIWVGMGRPDNRGSKISLSRPTEDATGSDFFLINGSEKPKKIGQDVVEGFKVTIRVGELLYFPPPKSHSVDRSSWSQPKGEPIGMSYEIWTSDELKMILLFKLKSGTAEFVQRYHNIRLQEPDPFLFQLPSGFRMVTSFTPTGPMGSCVPQEVGISGEPRPIEVTRPCTR